MAQNHISQTMTDVQARTAEPVLLPWAINKRQQEVPLAKGARATCSTCKATLLAYCGDVLNWHLHHEASADCDPWHEPKTEWHRKWKNEFEKEGGRCEITKGPHRADVITGKELVIEFQHSSLSLAEYQEREEFCRRMVWVFDARKWFCNFDLRMHPDKFTFPWKTPRQSMFSIHRPLFLDTGNEIFQVTFLHRDIPSEGIGRFIPYPHFIRAMNKADPESATVARIG
jgi:hypothetical protein